MKEDTYQRSSKLGFDVITDVLRMREMGFAVTLEL